MSTQSTNTEATAPTGDIKVFIDAFNKDFDLKLKSLLDNQQNYKNVYADAIKITTPKEGPWPNDPKVVTIGDLFKYTFPDIDSDNTIKPSKDTEDYNGWLKDLKNNKDEKISKMYYTISSGISSNKVIEDYQNLKKPGITNPSLWSPGQFYFDVFMSRILSTNGPLKNPSRENGGERAFGGDIIEGGGLLQGWLKNHGGSASVSNFDSNDNFTKESTLFGYSIFADILDGGDDGVGIKYLMSKTGVSIDLGDPSSTSPKSYVNLKTQYKTGLLSDFISIENGKIILKDPTFDIERGDIRDASDKYVLTEKILDVTNITGYRFYGNYEHILLYKAFVQAGDNYKTVVLPAREARQETPTPSATPPLVKVETPTAIGEVQFKFNVEKTDTFIVVGGTVSPPLEFTIVPNDGTEYIMDIFNDIDDLGEEYKEGQYEGTEEDLFKIQPGEPYPTADVESLNSLKGFDPNNPDETLSTDSTSKYPVSKDKDANAKAIISAAKSSGVTNKFAIAAILAIVSKESGFVPRSETSYAGTSGERIIKIFGSRGYSAAEWDVIKKDSVKFFNIVYGNKYGNGSSDGYKYRGRGFNQITFKGNYETYAKETGLNLINDPDLLNTVDAAAKCLIAYFKRGIKNAPSDRKSLYHFSDINSFKNLNDATGAMYHANAGWGKSYNDIVADSTGGRKKAFANAGPLYNTYETQIA